MKNKLFKILALFAMASMILAACGGNGSATQAPAEKAKVVIFVAHNGLGLHNVVRCSIVFGSCKTRTRL